MKTTMAAPGEVSVNAAMASALTERLVPFHC